MALSTFLEVGNNRLHSINDGFQHDCDYFIDLTVGQLHDRFSDASPSIVHPHVDMPKLLESKIANTFNIRSTGYISFDNYRFGPSFPGDPVQLIFPPSRENQLMALRPQLLGEGLPYATACACDDCYLVH